MSLDVQIVFPQEAVQLTRVQVIPGLVPRTLDVLGADFRSVDEVLINQIPSPDVVILSKTRLLAQVPDQIRLDRVVTVSVLSRKLTVTEKSFLRFRIGKAPGKVSGILRLLQLFLKILFTTPGSDIFNQKTGGAGLRNIGQTFGADEGGGIVSDFVVAIANTSRQIIAIQGRDPSLPRDERLLAAKILTAGFNRSEGALVVSVEVTSQAGRAATANVEL